MSEKLTQYLKIDFQNMFDKNLINIIIDSIGFSIILRSIHPKKFKLNLCLNYLSIRI